MANALRVIIAEDEAKSRNLLAELLRKADCKIVAEIETCESLKECLELNDIKQFDAIFLDINLRGKNSIETLKGMENLPPIVIVTGHREFGPEAFDVSVVDYLLKPLNATKLGRAITRVRAKKPHYLFTVTNGQNGLVIFDIRKVAYVEIDEGVVFVYSEGKRYKTTWKTLKEVESEYPFMKRIQRNILSRIDAIKEGVELDGRRAKLKFFDRTESIVDISALKAIKDNLKER